MHLSMARWWMRGKDDFTGEARALDPKRLHVAERLADAAWWQQAVPATAPASASS
jgi:hypothetical protein